MSKHSELRERIYRRRYVLPNLITIANLFCGFISIIYSMSNRPEKAVLAIILGIILDGLDGRVARKLNATSRFGLEMDSFADLVTFGMAPAILAYSTCFLPDADEFGVMIVFIYAVSAALRLARFNISEENLVSFLGLPSPAAAATIVSFVFATIKLEYRDIVFVCMSILMPLVSFLMISNLRFISIKKLKFSRMRTVSVFILALCIGLLWYVPKLTFLVISVGYCLSGPIIKWLEWRAKPVEAEVVKG